MEEFSERSYREASISRIVARAGIAKGSLYQYFDNKLDLYTWLVTDEALKKKVEFLKDHPPPEPGDFWGELEHLYRSGLAFGLAHPRLARIAGWLRHPPADEPDLVALSLEMDRMAHDNLKIVLQQGQSVGQVRDDLDLDLASDFLVAMTQRGLDLAITRAIGVDLFELCANPKLAERFSETARNELLHGLIDLLRRAFGTDASPSGHDPVIDIDEVHTGSGGRS